MRKKRWEWQAKSVKSQAFERIHSWYFVAYFVRFFTQTKPLPPPLLSKCIKCVPLKWVYATTRKSEGGKEESTKYATCTKRSIEYARGNFIKYIAIQWFIQSDFNVLHHLFFMLCTRCTHTHERRGNCAMKCILSCTQTNKQSLSCTLGMGPLPKCANTFY